MRDDITKYVCKYTTYETIMACDLYTAKRLLSNNIMNFGREVIRQMCSKAIILLRNGKHINYR